MSMIESAFDEFESVIKVVFETMSFKKGAGTTEAVISLVLVIGFLISLFINSPQTHFLEGLVALIVGYYFGRKREIYG